MIVRKILFIIFYLPHKTDDLNEINMALKEFCTTLLQCAEKLEEEVRYNINEFHNVMFGKNMDETKLALERAKDYHYKELLDAAGEILKNVKIIVFHQDKIEWLSKENNFSANDLKRFSYVKRQVYAFSKSDEKPSFSRSEENLSVAHKLKKEERRRASEVSIGSLEAWENYLDQKEKDASRIQENAAEEKNVILKRTVSNARRRKKFVSSTMGGFLDNEGTRRNNLVSILENSSWNDELYENDEEHIDESSNDKNNSSTVSKEFESNSNAVDEHVLNGTNERLSVEKKENIENDLACNISDSDNDENKRINRQYSDLVEMITESSMVESAIDEVKKGLLDGELQTADCQPTEDLKPKIVDVIYKKKPS